MADDKTKKTRIPTAKKRDIQGEKRNLLNRMFKSRVNTLIRKVEESIKAQKATNEDLSSLYSLVDKGVKKGVFKLNKGSRIKMRFAKQIKTA